MERTLESQRHLYNDALEHRILAWERKQKTITFFDQCKELTECRKDIPGMKETSVFIQRGTLKRVDDAYKGFFSRVRTGKKPGRFRFKGKYYWHSFDIVSGVKVSRGRIHIPGFGRMVVHRKGGNPHPDGLPVSATLKRVGAKWYAIICFKIESPEKTDNGISLGLDMNVAQVTDSDGVRYDLSSCRKLEERANFLQRRLSRGKKGSNRRLKAKNHLARVRRKMANRRRNRLHHISKRISMKTDTVYVENLQIKNMTKSAKGTIENPGSNVGRKAGLNRGILKTGWHQLHQMLSYKVKSVVAVAPHHTSQTCHVCGVRDSGSRRSQALFKCVSCGYAGNADVNAALNIMAFGIGASVRGGTGVDHPVNRKINTSGNECYSCI